MSQSSFHIKEDLSEAKKLQKRQKLLSELRTTLKTPELFSVGFDTEQIGKKNCENLIGSVEIPVGIAGPVDIKFAETLHATSILIPLATTEGALVASINRGCKFINQAGGAAVFVKKVGMTRSPVFRCQDGKSALEFTTWVDKNISQIKTLAESTSSHLKYLSHTSWIRGNLVFVRFNFDTEEAMGMNMLTIALQATWDKLLREEKQLQNIKLLSISGNVCTDKKDSAINKILGRGYWAQAEVKISHQDLDTELIYKTHVAKNLVGSNVASSLSQNMQVANAVAALYLATGQDMAHVVEGSQASTYLDLDADKNLYISVTMPNINVGVVGGGTYLSAQTQARNLIFRNKIIDARSLAAVTAVAALAGEISGLAALANNTLAKAHAKLGRIKHEI